MKSEKEKGKMFRFEGYCDDKHVPTVLRNLAGMVYQLQMLPVLNAEKKKNGEIKAQTSGSLFDQFTAWIGQNKLHEINAARIREFAASIGRRSGSSSYILSQLCKAGLIKKLGKGSGTYYKVMGKGK